LKFCDWTLAGTDHVDDQRLLWPGEELLVMTVGEVLLEIGGGVEVDAFTAGDADDKNVLLVGNATLAIVDNLAVAIEGEAIFNVAADVEDSDGFVGRSDGCEALSQWASGVCAVEDVDDSLGGLNLWNGAEGAYAVKIEHEEHENARGDEAKAGDAESIDHDEDESASAGSGQQGHDDGTGWRHGCAVGNKPRKEQGKDCHDRKVSSG
jgi:hypothetical protein